MSAETLRRAAALMRERAEAVIAAAAEPDQWFGQEELADCLFEGLGNEMGSPEADAAHIASWPPAVALAVAVWLGSVADYYVGVFSAEERYALAVARTYLREVAPC